MTTPNQPTPQAPDPTNQTGSPAGTAAPTSLWDAISTADEQNAVQHITTMLSGTQILKDEPGVVYSLAQQQAHPADAAAIDQFMQGLNAEKMVRVAQATNQKITLDASQKALLNGLQVDYSGVDATPIVPPAEATAAKLTQAGQEVKRNPDGSLMLDSSGNPQILSPKQYKAKGIGRFFQTLHNDFIKPFERDVAQPIGSAIAPVGNALNQAWNVVDQSVTHAYDAFEKTTTDLGVTGDILNPGNALRQVWDAANGKSVQLAPNFPAALKDVQQINPGTGGLTSDQRSAMTAAGYDPQNVFSVLAYRAKGLETGDLSPLAKQWDADNPQGLYGLNGDTAVAEAQKFMANPSAYIKGIENDSTLTPDQVAQKIQAVSSKQFMDLTRSVSGKTETMGNLTASQLGIDPVAHPTAFALTSAGSDMALSFMLDPTVVLGKVAKAAKIGQIGIDSLADTNGAVRALSRADAVHNAAGLKGIAGRLLAPSSNSLGRGWQGAIDLSGEIRDANAAGDAAKEAALTAKFNANYPMVAPLLPDFLGSDAITGFDKVTGKPIMGATDGIRSMDDAIKYVESKVALTRLMNGRAATQASLMPGAVSAFGIRKLKGLGAEWMTERSANRALGIQQAVVSAAKADPALAEKLITEGDLVRISAAPDDAVNAITGQVMAGTGEATASAGLASATRGATTDADLALTAQGKGTAAYNVRKSGNPLDDSLGLGYVSPTAIAARARLAAQRFTTLLPRNTNIALNDAQSGDKIYKMAMTYMNRGDARMLQAAWNAGDGGARKEIVNGLIDQTAHAAGIAKSAGGKDLLDSWKTRTQAYSAAGDEVTVDGQNLALHPGQVRTQWVLPTFRDLQLASSKIGLWESSFGRALTSTQADGLMNQWKMGALFKPSTMTRNLLEGWLRTALEGQGGKALKARALLTTPNQELWKHGLALEEKATYERLLADGDTAGAKLVARATKLSGQYIGRSAPGEALAHFAPFALAGRAYRGLVGKFMDESDHAALETMGRDELSENLDAFGQMMKESDLGYRNLQRQSTKTAEAGFLPATFKRTWGRFQEQATGKVPAGHVTNWLPQDTAGPLGVERYANALAQRVNTAPSVAKAVLDRIEHPETFGLDHIVAALDDPAVARQMHLTSYGSLFWEDGADQARRALNPDEVALGKQEWAQKLVNDYSHMMVGQNGVYQQKLADAIRTTGQAPDSAWLEKNLKGLDRPETVLAPEVTAVPAGGGFKGLVQALQDVQGVGYQWMVERPLQRTTSSPVFWANYAMARKGLNPYVEKLIAEHGVSEEAAGEVAKELAVRNAWVKMEQLIDDPGQKSQFDIVARNMFPFSRASQAMVRRWGGGLWQDPTRARKMMLAYEGGVHSGLIYTNTYGEPTFTYPGSGVLNSVLRDTVGHIPGFQNMFMFPLASNMTGGVLMAVPGADNPLRMSMGPMISIPMREIFKLFPDHRQVLDEIDSAINGPIGVGETWSQLVPTAPRKFFTALNEDQRNSALASSMVGAIANLAAAGMLPPPGASKDQYDAFLQRVKTQVRSQLFLRAVFGLVAPAAPSAPTDGTAASQADYAFKMEGIGQLSDEYKTIMNDVGGNLPRANAIWNALHPDKLVYEYAHSQANASKVTLPSTAEALDWMSKNSGFVGKYKSVAAYFLPQSTTNEPFNDQAYKTQIELGLRQRLTPEEFYQNLRVRNAESTYYPTKAQFDNAIAQAKQSGNKDQYDKLVAGKSQWETDFKNMNPLFAQKIDSFPDARAQAASQLASLKTMVQSGEAPDGTGPQLQSMLTEWDNYQAFIGAHKGTDTANTDMRKAALDMFNNWVGSHVAGTSLQDLYQGVFRALDTNIVNLAPPTTSGAAK